MPTDSNEQPILFKDLGLADNVLKTVNDIGYENPTPIQAATIPPLLDGKDVIGQAQTGTGKTAAFALPILSRLDLKQKNPQVLVLTPTRELAIQVAEAFQGYAAHLKNFHVLPIYGGSDYSNQFRHLKRGVHVVVGTPGRVMDHMKRGTLKLEDLSILVLDEADEMLRMGFIDDVEWILDQTPNERQIALFSATMPTAIRRIAKKYLNSPQEITTKFKTATAETIRQRFWVVSGLHKLDALTRIIEAEPIEATLIFVRTKTKTVELAEKLEARGYPAVALNGDIPQKKRERTIELLKKGKIDIVVATDVAARGLDVNRISHVINYDIPMDTESYIHRIGRTGRAGKSGEAILFVAPREKRLLQAIEKATKKKIEVMQMPSTKAINRKRVAQFKQRITDTMGVEDLTFFCQIVEEYQAEYDKGVLEIGAALARMAQGDEPLLIKDTPPSKGFEEDKGPRKKKDRKKSSSFANDEIMANFRIEVGRNDGAQPKNIVGAIANEIGLDSQYIGHIEINDDHSLVALPDTLPAKAFKILEKVRIGGKSLSISPSSKPARSASRKGRKPERGFPKRGKFSKRAGPRGKRKASKG